MLSDVRLFEAVSHSISIAISTKNHPNRKTFRELSIFEMRYSGIALFDCRSSRRTHTGCGRTLRGPSDRLRRMRKRRAWREKVKERSGARYSKRGGLGAEWRRPALRAEHRSCSPERLARLSGMTCAVQPGRPGSHTSEGRHGRTGVCRSTVVLEAPHS